MKNYFLITLLLLTCWGCKDETEETAPSEVTYEVIAADSGFWHGEYIVETGEKICNCSQPFQPSGWTYKFKTSKKPFTLHIDATTNSALFGEANAPDVTTNIYVNNKLVATNTSNWAPGLASADYVIE